MAVCTNLSIMIASWILSIYLHFLLLHKNVTCKSIERQILDSAPEMEMFDVFHIMKGAEVMIMTELDLLLSMDQYRSLYNSPNTPREKRKARRDLQTQWTNCKVYYEITESLDSIEIRNIIKEAIDEWEKFSCLDFEESTTETRRIQFQDGGGCYSQVGMQKEPQPIALAPGCRTKGIIVHEIGHAIGWYHEHMRPDRDKFIKINYDVIAPRFHPNFESYNSSVINTYNIPYDYTSIMHYGSDVLPGSIVTLDTSFQDKIGQRQGMTFKDIKTANIMYNCHQVMGCPNKNCNYSGFVFYKPHNREPRCSCWCDSGNVDDPLILCSSLNKEPPSLKLRDIKLPTTKPCYDVREKCEDLKLQDNNICMKKMDLMMAFCAKTCNFCGRGEDKCMDYEKGCPILAASKACKDPAFESLLETMCPASCGKCEKSSPCEIMHDMMGSTEKNDGSGLLATLMTTYLVACHLVVCLTKSL
uniref:Metalloendopeptidase n=1 Tax=Arion vulgaris TaxID=1028688 RepID=A0A0B7A6T8_9EUPU